MVNCYSFLTQHMTSMDFFFALMLTSKSEAMSNCWNYWTLNMDGDVVTLGMEMSRGDRKP